MGAEILVIPEDDLRKVIAIIREGMCAVDVDEPLAEYLNEWCDGEEAYLDREH